MIQRNREPSQEKRPFWNPNSKRIYGLRLWTQPKKERLRLTLTVIEVKNTRAQDYKKSNSTCSLHVIHPQLLMRNIYFCIYIFGLQK